MKLKVIDEAFEEIVFETEMIPIMVLDSLGLDIKAQDKFFEEWEKGWKSYLEFLYHESDLGSIVFDPEKLVDLHFSGEYSDNWIAAEGYSFEDSCLNVDLSRERGW